MKTGSCRCGNRIFFANYQCIRCEAVLGRCAVCEQLTSFTTQSNGGLKCDRSPCGGLVTACKNRELSACNSTVDGSVGGACQWCLLTSKLPNLTLPDNVRRWSALERAKRQLLLQLADLGLPPYVDGVQDSFPLSFEFLQDEVDEAGNTKPVFTGHTNGVITINVSEADSVHREKLRVSLGEPQRTLIGHMRHEIGHYLQWCYVDRVAAEPCKNLFGDPASLDYETAKQRYYQEGPIPDWQNSFVSAYATMHPWEDFAETVNVYLDLAAIATTANDQGMGKINMDSGADANQLVRQTLEIAIAVSEFNLDLGLAHLLPEQLSPQVIGKIAFVHRMRSEKYLSRLRDLQHV